MDVLELTHNKLDLNKINDLVAHESCGAISFFIGTTRDNFDGKQVISLEYEAYEQMAIKAMKKICDEVRSKWEDIVNIAIYHRLGIVPVKETSVIIAISSPHRLSSLDAVQYTIEKLKKYVPIWKKEYYNDSGSTSAWKENKECLKPIRNRENSSESQNIIKKRKILNFDCCKLVDDKISKNLIQIQANEDEVNKRIECFIQRKRDEINLGNIQDFILRKTGENDLDTSCARVDSVAFKLENFKGHLKVHRVKNLTGPQISINYKDELDKLMGKSFKIKQENDIKKSNESGVVERLENIEVICKLGKPVSKDIYERIKIIEDRLLYLESISPEYFKVLKEDDIKYSSNYKKSYNLTDLDKLIEEINNKN